MPPVFRRRRVPAVLALGFLALATVAIWFAPERLRVGSDPGADPAVRVIEAVPDSAAPAGRASPGPSGAGISSSPLLVPVRREVRRLAAALEAGYPVALTIAGEEPRRYMTAPRRVTADDFQITLGTERADALPAEIRVAQGRRVVFGAAGGRGDDGGSALTLSDERVSIAVVGDRVAAVVEEEDGTVIEVRTDPETGELRAVRMAAAPIVCDLDEGGGTSTLTAHAAPEEVPMGAAQLEPDVENAGGIDPGTGRLDKYVEPIPLGRAYDMSLKDMLVLVALDKDATGSFDIPNLTAKTSEYLARMANVAAVHEHQLGVRSLVQELILTPNSAEFADIPPTLDNFRNWVGANRSHGTYRWNAAAKFGLIGASGGTIGVGYVGALSGSFGVCVNVKGFTHALVAHELGHVMGSGHSSGGIMNPSIITGTRDFFTDVSTGETAAKDIYDHSRTRLYGRAELRHPEEIPFAVDDSRTTPVNTPIQFNPLGNDRRDVRNGTASTTLTLEETSRVNPLHAGTASVSGGEIVFTPATGYTGVAHFSYSVRGDVGNGGRGWLHKGDVAVVVGSYNPDALSFTLAPGQVFSFRPSGGTPEIRSQPSHARVDTSRDDRQLVIVRVLADATGSDSFVIRRSGADSPVNLTYRPVASYLTLAEDVIAFDGTSGTIDFNPLVNDQGGGYRSPVTIDPVLHSGGQPITYYFRRRFHLRDADVITGLTLDLLRDDGAVVYVNGQEAARSNMPAGAIASNTLASSSAGGAAETTYFPVTLDPALLRDGLNVVAVEVHQSSATSSDIGFDAELRGAGASGPVMLIPRRSTWRYRDDGRDPAAGWTAVDFNDGAAFTSVGFGPDSGAKFVTTYFRRQFSVSNPAAYSSLALRFRRDDGAVIYLNGSEIARSNMPVGTVAHTTLASGGASDDGDVWQIVGVSPAALQAGTNTFAVEIHQTSRTSSDIVFDLELIGLGPGVAETLVATGETWKFLDNGTNQGTAWSAQAFNDAAWASGPSPLGYPFSADPSWSGGAGILGFGDGVEATTLGQGSEPLDLLPGAFRIVSAQNLTPTKGSLNASERLPFTIGGQSQNVFTGNMRFTPTPGATGIARIEYVAEDGAGNQRTGTVSIVLPLVEVASPAASPAAVDVRNGVILRGAALDVGVMPAWSLVEAPADGDAVIESPNALETAATFTAPGDYRFRLTGTTEGFATFVETVIAVKDFNAVPAAGAVMAHWTLDEGSGLFAFDSSGAGRHGVLFSGAAWAADGVRGGALDFNTNAFVELSESLDAFRSLSAGSISLWFRTTTGSQRTILGASDSGDPDRDLRLFIEDGLLSFKVRGDFGTDQGSLRSNVAVTDGQWHHAVVTVDAAMNASLYLDGELQAAGVRPFFAGVADLDSLSLGRVVHSGAGTLFFRGGIDDVKIFSRPLDAADAAELAAARLPHGPLVKLPSTRPIVPPSSFNLGLLSPAVVADGAVATRWSSVSGAGVVFGNSDALDATAFFTQPGTFTLRLTAETGEVTTFADVTVAHTAGGNGVPIALGIPNVTAPQNAPPGSADLFAAFADSEDPDTALNFSIVSVAGDSVIAPPVIEGQFLKWTYPASASGAATVTVVAEDTDGNNSPATFTITVRNEAPTLRRQTFALSEDALNGTIVGTVRAVDPDGDPMVFSLVGDPSGGAFSLDPGSGVLRLADGSKLDFEAASSYPLEIAARDAASTTRAQFLVALTDVNEAPQLGDVSVDLNQGAPAGTPVATLSAADPEGGQLSFAIVSGNESGAFAIDANGILTVARSSPLTFSENPRFTLGILATDDGAPARSALGTVRVTLGRVLVADNAAVRVRVPTSSADDATWRQVSFSDGAWTQGQFGIGYDENTDYLSLIRTDVGAQMNGLNQSVYARAAFIGGDVSGIGSLMLRMKYDDGFVAYLNGREIARRNAPAILAWNSGASASHGDSEAEQFEDIDVSAAVGDLVTGTNVLAIHGLNSGVGSSDMLIVPQLVATASGTAAFPEAPALALGNAQNITATGATLVGSITATGGSRPVVTFVWGTRDGGSDPSGWEGRHELGERDPGQHTHQVTQLRVGTRYFFNFIGENAGGRSIAGPAGSFTTQSGPASILFAPGGPLRVRVPEDGSLGGDWREPGFNDSGWTAGSGGVGYDTGTGYEPFIGVDVEAAMHGRNASVLVRAPFTAPADFAALDRIVLGMRYDDGFVAFLNGVEIARRSAPAGSPAWNTAATANRNDSDAIVFEDIDVSGFRGALRNGANMLAIHGLNAGADSSDMLIAPRLLGYDLDAVPPGSPPSVDLDSAAAAVSDAAVRGRLVTPGGQRPALRIYFGRTDAGAQAAGWDGTVDAGALSAGDFQVVLSGLAPATEYFARASATNAAGAAWSPTAVSFTTDPAAPVTAPLVPIGAVAKFHVPVDDSLGTAWRARGFDASAWSDGVTGLGYDTSGVFAPLIATDVQAAMRARSAGLFARISFDVIRPEDVLDLALRVKFDDAFAAYLNGAEIARSAGIPSPLSATSAATVARSDSGALVFQEFDVSAAIPLLETGLNVLAIHALNDSAGGSDALLAPELVASVAAPLTGSDALAQFAAWAAAANVPPDLAGPNDDADRDGITNLGEYSRGSNPVSPDRGGPFAPVIGRSGENLTVTFVRRADAAARGLSYAVEMSSGLAGWSAAPQSGPPVIAAGPQQGLETVTITITPPPNAGAAYVRIATRLE